MKPYLLHSIVFLMGWMGITNCTQEPTPPIFEKSEYYALEVEASAYTCRIQRNPKKPVRGAWGDILTTDTKAIAVSNDLIKMGLKHGTSVKIEGLEGNYVVMDKMANRWRKTIDIYMGNACQKARCWGRRKTIIYW
jgi:3D (Asp-Asp-Asp) domain-containing protein